MSSTAVHEYEAFGKMSKDKESHEPKANATFSISQMLEKSSGFIAEIDKSLRGKKREFIGLVIGTVFAIYIIIFAFLFFQS
jgi:hypothetical protein